MLRAVVRPIVEAFGGGELDPIDVAREPDDWRDFARRWLCEQELSGDIAMLVAGPSERSPDASHRIEGWNTSLTLSLPF